MGPPGPRTPCLQVLRPVGSWTPPQCCQCSVLCVDRQLSWFLGSAWPWPHGLSPLGPRSPIPVSRLVLSPTKQILSSLFCLHSCCASSGKRLPDPYQPRSPQPKDTSGSTELLGQVPIGPDRHSGEGLGLDSGHRGMAQTAWSCCRLGQPQPWQQGQDRAAIPSRAAPDFVISFAPQASGPSPKPSERRVALAPRQPAHATKEAPAATRLGLGPEELNCAPFPAQASASCWCCSQNPVDASAQAWCPCSTCTYTACDLPCTPTLLPRFLTLGRCHLPHSSPASVNSAGAVLRACMCACILETDSG